MTSWRYDGFADALYIHVAVGRPAKQETITESVIVDLDHRGQVLGVEILDASLGWDTEMVSDRFELGSVAKELLRRLSKLSLPRSHDVDRPTKYTADPVTLDAISAG